MLNLVKSFHITSLTHNVKLYLVVISKICMAYELLQIQSKQSNVYLNTISKSVIGHTPIRHTDSPG